MIKIVLTGFSLLLSFPAVAQQQLYSFNGLSLQDIAVIGKALQASRRQMIVSPTITLYGLTRDQVLSIGDGMDKLPREETDELHGNIYHRMQAQITSQDQAALKAAVDTAETAKKKEIEDAIKAAKESEP